jgi:hypothetical protein
MASDIFDSAIGKPEHKDYSSSVSPWYPQQQHLGNLFANAQNQFNQGPYSGPFLGAQSPYTRQAQGMIVNQALNPNSLTSQSQRQIGDTISGKYLDPKTNPYLEGSVNDALGLAKSQFLGLYGGDAGSNIGNSGFQEQLARTLANSALPAYQNAYSQERQNQLNAMNLAPQFDYANANALAGVGASQEGRSQAEVEAQRQAFNAPWENLARYQSMVTGDYGKVGTTQQPWQSQLWNTSNNMAFGPFGQGNGPQIFGGAMQGASSFFSDVRLKENIERIGTADEGYGIYRYNYKGDDTPLIGVLAQEVEQVRPEAVGEVAGFKTVNYKMI